MESRAISGMPVEACRVYQRQQIFVPRPCQSVQFERIQVDALAAARVTNHQARPVAVIVAFDFDCREFANQAQDLPLEVAVRMGFQSNNTVKARYLLGKLGLLYNRWEFSECRDAPRGHRR